MPPIEAGRVLKLAALPAQPYEAVITTAFLQPGIFTALIVIVLTVIAFNGANTTSVINGGGRISNV
ncbi:hypothetical protein PLESHI_07149 [Plesiomonas shigelloides 302-73]|uniref:Uncharacterized protein n=1 Tax=Plesiomonas shigelloides 302-73 TaxID=1315976 RepID=R8AS21_PLESH|nr:hypothetical protein PLESHI_07149 [Plesiomonas shigelloides 302-73]